MFVFVVRLIQSVSNAINWLQRLSFQENLRGVTELTDTIEIKSRVETTFTRNNLSSYRLIWYRSIRYS